MASRVLDRVINDAQVAAQNGNVNPAARGAANGRGQVFDGEGNRIASSNYTQKRYNAAGDELPESKGWINIGYVKALPDAMGNMVKRFINLASGIPVDSIPVFKASPTNKLRHEQNHLGALVKDELEQMQPGEERILHLEVRLRRVYDQSEIALQTEELGVPFSLSSPVNDDDAGFSEAETE